MATLPRRDRPLRRDRAFFVPSRDQPIASFENEARNFKNAGGYLTKLLPAVFDKIASRNFWQTEAAGDTGITEQREDWSE
jgi:hypothetical protein